MRSSRKAIVTCAVTGSVHTPTMSKALPITPDEIAAESVAAAEAGAAIIHLHARDPQTGAPTPDPAVFLEFVPRIKAATDAVINISTGGSTTMTLDERLAAAKQLAPEVATLNMGSMNFVFAGAAARYSEWQHPWEKDYVLGSADRVFANTFAQIEYTMKRLGQEGGSRFEFECYDVGHLYSLAHFVDRGLVEPPFFVQCIFGILGGIGADHSNLGHMVSIADRLFGEDYYLSAFGAGHHQMSFLTHSAMLGGHVRVGLEDNLYIGKGELATGNAEQVRKAVRILAEMGREPATPAEAREMLGLKGRDSVAF